MSLIKIFGKNPTGKRLERIQQSPNYRNNQFQNLSHTLQLAKDSSYLSTSKEFFKQSKRVKPNTTLPFVKFHSAFFRRLKIQHSQHVLGILASY